jgi:hemerythrin-like domain-containing protein
MSFVILQPLGASPRYMTNPIDIIKADHRKMEKLFKEYEDLDATALESKASLVTALTDALKLHMDMEERFLYPMLKNAFADEEDKLVEESYAEHDVAKRILEELTVTHPEDPQYDARVKVLSENITHHVMEEEEELLPKTEKNLGKDDLETIGEEMRKFRMEVAGEEV